ncbi:hypothetical protein JZ751_016974 [Albula glossodonta]|uniref:Uncharacterized protein n=1 Tax=Albula glossodonta TaxID=121402 RepID=A0A8T2MIH5_9TELE|nr:hypothetical protein JZ751_016974 [Albula glossodonta]
MSSQWSRASTHSLASEGEAEVYLGHMLRERLRCTWATCNDSCLAEVLRGYVPIMGLAKTSCVFPSFTEKPAIAPPVFVFQKEKATKRAPDGSSGEDGEDSDKEDGCYSPPVKRERTSSQTQFPPSHSVSKNNVFLPSSFCQSPTGNSDSEPEEKTVGFRLKPPTLIHGQAPSAGGAEHGWGCQHQKPKEQQRTVLRPALLQAPPTKALTQSKYRAQATRRPMCVFDLHVFDLHVFSFSGLLADPSGGTNGLKPSEEQAVAHSKNDNTHTAPGEASTAQEGKAPRSTPADPSFVFGQNIKERAKVTTIEGPPSDGVVVAFLSVADGVVVVAFL